VSVSEFVFEGGRVRTVRVVREHKTQTVADADKDGCRNSIITA
jgi:hypothetical protein